VLVALTSEKFLMEKDYVTEISKAFRFVTMDESGCKSLIEDHTLMNKVIAALSMLVLKSGLED